MIERFDLEATEYWRDIATKTPWLKFPADWKIRIIPPFGGTVARFLVTKEGLGEQVSIYLDWYERAGLYGGQPYWEVYPIGGDVGRCGVEDVDKLLGLITESLEQLSKDKKENNEKENSNRTNSNEHLGC